jgi:hypothetical protein
MKRNDIVITQIQLDYFDELIEFAEAHKELFEQWRKRK